MHGATQWSIMGQSFVGNRTILVPKFDPHEVWRLVESEKANSVMITGDAMGKPLIEALDDPGADYDLSSLLAVTSSAALFSAPVKDEFFRHFPDLVIVDAIGSSESGNNGMATMGKGDTAMKSGPTVTVLGDTVVFDEDLKPVVPGSGVIGKIARSGDIPVGYYNDPVKTAEVFITRRREPLRDARRLRHHRGGRHRSPCSAGDRCPSTPAARRSSPRRSSRRCGPTPTCSTPSWSAPPTSDGASGWPPSSSPGPTGTRPSRTSRSTAATPSPATRCPASSTWSTPSCAPRAASPTTGGPPSIVAEVPEETDSGGARTASGTERRSAGRTPDGTDRRACRPARPGRAVATARC